MARAALLTRAKAVDGVGGWHRARANAGADGPRPHRGVERRLRGREAVVDEARRVAAAKAPRAVGARLEGGGGGG